MNNPNSLGLKLELRDRNTIRAYLDELVLLQTPIQLWVDQEDEAPFVTTLTQVGQDTFTTAQAPGLAAGQPLSFSFPLEGRRFTAHTQVVSSAVLRIPASVAQGERRERLRALFHPGDGIEVFACEVLAPPFVLGRAISGRMVDLSTGGLRVVLDELADLSDLGRIRPLRRGDALASICIRGLPRTPVIQCQGILAHTLATPDGPTAGIMLAGLDDAAQAAIEGILGLRFPAAFGPAFPRKKRVAEGVPQAFSQAAPLPSTVVLRLRKAGHRVLVIADDPEEGPSLVDQLRGDDFKRVFPAKSYLEAQTLARSARFDLVLLDTKVGGHAGQVILESLRRNGLLLDSPVILIADRQDAEAYARAEAVAAFHVHERGAPYEDLLPVLYGLLV